MRISHGVRILVCAITLQVLALQGTRACDTPVFRYALEQWPPAVYTVLLFHDGPLTDAEQALADEIKTLGREPKLLTPAAIRGETAESGEEDANAPDEEDGTSDAYPFAPYPSADLVAVDVSSPPDGMPEALIDAWKEAAAKEPTLVVPHPRDYTGEYILWSGPLTAENIDLMFESPARRTIARRILGGEAIVWLLLQCGDEALDKKAEETLEAEIESVRKMVEEANRALAPPPGPEDAANDAYAEEPIEEGLPAFSMLRVKQDDPKEAFFVATLLKSEEGLEELRDEPMVFPMFGRARAAYALVGEGIARENIEETCYYLTGPCSCQIKDMNPGMDILVNIDWDGALHLLAVEEQEDYAPGGPLVGLGSIAEAAAASADVESNQETSEDEDNTAKDGDDPDAASAQGPTAEPRENGSLPPFGGEPAGTTATTAAPLVPSDAEAEAGPSANNARPTGVASFRKLFVGLGLAAGVVVLFAVVFVAVIFARGSNS